MAHTELNLNERRRFYRLRDQKLPIAEIARIMDRHKSTLYREQKRNFWKDDELPETNGYWPVSAHEMAQDRRLRQRKLVRHTNLRLEVLEKIKKLTIRNRRLQHHKQAA